MIEKVKRRLTTVLCADVYGYSRLMEADEAGTLEALRRARAAMARLVERHDGRIVNTWGDAVIAEFPSVVEAVQCAVETQQELKHQESDRPDGQRMLFRIGINLGDVMVDGSDIYGDGVNIAARLQELAEPGGILVSGPVYDQVHNKLSVGFDYLGRQQVKNVAAPVMSYRVSLNGTAAEARAAGREEPVWRPDVAGAAPATSAGGTELPALGPARAFSRLPRPIRVALVVSVFLFLINVFSGMDSVWFHWPVASILLIATLRTMFRRGPAGDGRSER
jgi:adenylate cyclase